MLENWETFARRFRWLSTTPFGSPELPLVKSSTASSWPPPDGRRSSARSTRHGSRKTSIRQSAILFFNGGKISSSRSTSSGQGKSGSRFITGPAVMACRMPAMRMAASSEARPEVKFRFTATFPARVTAAFAITAALPGGSTMAMRFSGPCKVRARAMAAASTVPREVTLPSDAIHDRGAELPAFQPPQAGLRQVPPQERPALVAPFPQHQQPLAHEGDAGLLRGNRLPECHRDRVGNAARPFPEITSALKGKDGAPEPVHPHRHHRRPGLARDQLKPAPQPQQRAGAAQLSLGKNADHLPGPDAFRRRADGLP